jgi:hypothetical protein
MQTLVKRGENMSVTEPCDKRLQENRLLRGELSREEVETSDDALPDLSEEVVRLTDEELIELRKSLESEHAVRQAWIERALSEPEEPAPQPAPPIVPIDPEG